MTMRYFRFMSNESCIVAAFLSLMLSGLPAFAQEQGVDAAMPKFDVLEFAIEGNTRLTDLAIERAVMPFLGEGKTLNDVEAARTALEAAYRDAGYLTVVVSIPEQDVGGGEVRLNVLEGQVERLRVKGAEYHLASGIKKQLPELAPGNVPYFPQVQRELDALNRSSDLKAAPVLKAGRSAGTVEVQIEVEDELPLHGSIDYNNRQSVNTTAQRLAGTLRYDNLWQSGHSASLTAQVSPEKTDEVRTAAGTYVLPVGGGGDALALYSVVSRSKLATLAGSPGLGLLGNTNIYGFRYVLALPGLENFSQSLSLGLDYKDVKQSVIVANSAELPTPITYAPMVLAYAANWLGNGSVTTFDATATHGVRGLFGSNDEAFNAKRHGASASFFALRSGIRHSETISRWTLSGKLEVQVASGPLVSNEQFAAGGAESVRGYYEGERVGDNATRWAIEARTPKLNLAGKGSPWALSGIAFYEGARLRTQQPGALQPPVRLLRGTGVGLRATGSHGLSLDIDWAYALDDADLTRAGDSRVLARLLLDF